MEFYYAIAREVYPSARSGFFLLVFFPNVALLGSCVAA
jgi:hypothetical protein